jgi:O-methyltransferase involved in polyketide biosynthesis
MASTPTGKAESMALDPLSSTALIPFWCRVVDALSPVPVLGDVTAVALADRVADRYGRVEVDESTVLGCCLRNRTMDAWITRLACEHHSGALTVVDVGVGLDTRLFRLPGVVRRYLEIDSDNILNLREDWLTGTDAVRLPGDGMRIEDWIGKVAELPAVVVLEGVLTYQPPDVVAGFFAGLAAHLPGSYVLFDSLAPWQARTANNANALRSGRPPYQWAVRTTRRIQVDSRRLRIIDEKGFMDFPRQMTKPFGPTARLFHAVPGLRRSYRLTLAQLPDEGP